MLNADVLIIGASAAGLMCAIEAGKRGRQVLVLDHSNKVGKKILMSGGGYCNFTNQHAGPDNYLSHNPHFCKSALSRFTQWDFIELVKKYQIPFHEKTLGQLFCDRKSKDIVDMLLAECSAANVTILLNTPIHTIQKIGDIFTIKTNQTDYHAPSLVIATGGLSIPTMGATPFGYQIAKQFGIAVWPTRAGLVPLTLHDADKAKFSTLSGISVEALVHTNTTSFRENILFTHRGLSGPAILQISSYWTPGETLLIQMLPELDWINAFETAQSTSPASLLRTFLNTYLPKRVITTFVAEALLNTPLRAITTKAFSDVTSAFSDWQLKPNGTEGYRTAEVTLGGIDCNALSSKTMESLQVKGLYFIGEVVDVSGWLGGYNFQWAWSSGWAAGQVV